MNGEVEKSQIRVLIVDDSAFMRTALSRMVASDPGLWVVGTASGGAEGLQKVASLDPDVVTLDMQMPGIDGLETLRRIMAQFPRPVIVVSSATLKEAEITLNALEAGAFDYVPKQLSPSSLDILHIREELIAKIKAAAESRRSRDRFPLSRKPPRTVDLPARKLNEPAALVALGISTGGPNALQEILPTLPADLPVPVVVVQHMPPGFTAPFAERLNKLSAISIHEASHGELVHPGVVYIAPAGSHLRVSRPTESRTVIFLSDKREDKQHIPSVDIMMQSAASAFHSQAMGVIMTGMGSDGAQGMSAIHREGGFTLGQDESSCAVYGMPRVCAEMGILDRILPLSQIPNEILHAAGYREERAIRTSTG
ncbi:MAG: chemotaxis response regulator protein-glutamate methylesterase [Candidatus Sulfotelmatobacter sp.]